MENLNIKCSLKKHCEIEAISYCCQCKTYFCNKCQNFHSEIFENHKLYKLNEDINGLFTGFCSEKNHYGKLKYFCKSHNKLCCAECITKLKDKENGQHTDCNVCFIEEIKDEKKNKLKDNIKCLEDLLNTLKNSINNLKNILENINEKKEKIKKDIQTFFTNIRNQINDREDKLLLELDNYYKNSFINDDIIKESEKLPNKIKKSLEKGKSIDNDWNSITDIELNALIFDCINIENNIKYINIINEKIEKGNSSSNQMLKFNSDYYANNLLNEIKNKEFFYFSGKFKFKQCPLNINENKTFTVSGINESIITKKGYDNKYYGNLFGPPTRENINYVGIICKNILEKEKNYIWKIKILKTKNYDILIGVSPHDFNIGSTSFLQSGWYLACDNLKLYSGKPFNYNGKETNLKKIKNEKTVIFNMKKAALKFIIDNEDKGYSYKNIPMEKPISPVVFLKDMDDSVEILEY